MEIAYYDCSELGKRFCCKAMKIAAIANKFEVMSSIVKSQPR
jgi:hypothetical protein